jgi:hypothetical protein
MLQKIPKFLKSPLTTTLLPLRAGVGIESELSARGRFTR